MFATPVRPIGSLLVETAKFKTLLCHFQLANWLAGLSKLLSCRSTEVVKIEISSRKLMMLTAVALIPYCIEETVHGLMTVVNAQGFGNSDKHCKRWKIWKSQ